MLTRILPVFIFTAAIPVSAFAQSQSATRAVPKTWQIDFSGAAGISPGIGSTTTGFDLTGAATLVRSSHPDEFSHRCWGITLLATNVWANSSPELGRPRERGLFVGPRWDNGDPDGPVFLRVFAGARRLSSEASDATTTLAIGAGLGIEVLGILLDTNVVLSPWNDTSPYRVTFSAGYIWSWRLHR